MPRINTSTATLLIPSAIFCIDNGTRDGGARSPSRSPQRPVIQQTLTNDSTPRVSRLHLHLPKCNDPREHRHTGRRRMQMEGEVQRYTPSVRRKKENVRQEKEVEPAKVVWWKRVWCNYYEAGYPRTRNERPTTPSLMRDRDRISNCLGKDINYIQRSTQRPASVIF